MTEAIMSRFAALLCALLLAMPAWAINKCTAPDGKVTYQREPCPNKGRALDIADGNDPLPARAAQAARRAQAVDTHYPDSVIFAPPSGATYSLGGAVDTGSNWAGGAGVLHTGRRGGVYTIGPSGGRNYVSSSRRR